MHPEKETKQMEQPRKHVWYSNRQEEGERAVYVNTAFKPKSEGGIKFVVASYHEGSLRCGSKTAIPHIRGVPGETTANLNRGGRRK